MSWESVIAIISSLLTLTLLEVILGVDNLVFISILSHQLPKHQQKTARRVGLIAALATRLLLLALAFWITDLTMPLLTIHGFDLSWRNLFFLLGGLFLFIKSIHEIHREYHATANLSPARKKTIFIWVIVQIGLFDIIFSLDSILTAVGLSQQYWVMAVAITIAIAVMFFSSEVLSRFIQKHPTIRTLALSFLLLIGMVLVADGMHFYIPRGYLYFAVCFSLLVEVLNQLIARKKKKLTNQ